MASIFTVAAALACLLFAAAAQADTVTLETSYPVDDPTDRGAFNWSGAIDIGILSGWKGAPGTIAVRAFGDGGVYSGGTPTSYEVQRMYHIFDLSGVEPGTITAATLKIPHSNRSYVSYNPSGPGDSSETAAFFDVSTSPDVLRDPDESQGVTLLNAIWNDLGTGVEYGSFTATSASNGTIEEITLNANAIASLNAAAGGEWAIGAAIQSNNHTAFGAEEQIFKGSEDGRNWNPGTGEIFDPLPGTDGYPFYTPSQLELTVEASGCCISSAYDNEAVE
jgi:opacity protein-like surface antigen